MVATQVLEYENTTIDFNFCVILTILLTLCTNLFAESPIKPEASDHQEQRRNYYDELRLSQISLQESSPFSTSKFKQNDSNLSDERLPVFNKKENYGWLESANYPGLVTHVYESTPGTVQIRALTLSILNKSISIY